MTTDARPLPTTLAEWLLEQIAADEQLAREAEGFAGSPWHWGSYPRGARWGYGLLGRHPYQTGQFEVAVAATDDGPHRAPAAHIAAWDPARVLAECAAKRRIVQAWTERWREAEEAGDLHHGMLASQATGLGIAVRLLIPPYADRPGFREEWLG